MIGYIVIYTGVYIGVGISDHLEFGGPGDVAFSAIDRKPDKLQPFKRVHREAPARLNRNG